MTHSFKPNKDQALLAHSQAATSFANALLKEFPEWQRLANNHSWRKQLPDTYGTTACLALNNVGSLLIPVEQYSQCGVYRCYQPWWFVANNIAAEISLPEAAQRLEQCFGGQDHPLNSLGERVKNSVDEVTRLFQQQPDNTQPLLTDDFISSEQALLGGHPSHPCPRSKDGFSQQDSQQYAPEFKGQFGLHWWAVAVDCVVSDYRGRATQQRLEQLFQQEPEYNSLKSAIPNGYMPWPMHPWQAQQLSQQPRLQSLRNSGELIDLGSGTLPWSATSSLRCIYSKDAPYMLKFSMSVRLTNSLRHLQEEEVERGMQVVDIWDSPRGQRLQQQLPSFSIIKEPAWLALKDENGVAMASTYTVLRDNIFQGEASHNVFLLGALCQLPPAGQQSQLATLINAKAAQERCSSKHAAKDWLQRFLHIAIEPFLLAQANEGLLFGAHQQNLLIKITDYNPSHAYYRDCQGTGFSDLGCQLHQQVLAKFNDERNQLSQQTGNYLFSYYLIVNSLFAVIASLAMDKLLPEAVGLAMCREFFLALRNRSLADHSCLDYLLTSPELFFKGNLRCSLQGINENTMADPLALYLPLQNPLFKADLSQPQTLLSNIKETICS